MRSHFGVDEFFTEVQNLVPNSDATDEEILSALQEVAATQPYLLGPVADWYHKIGVRGDEQVTRSIEYVRAKGPATFGADSAPGQVKVFGG